MDWDQVAIEADYKDSRSAMTMGSRLIKKLTGNGAAAAAAPPPPVAEEDGDDAGEGSSNALARPPGSAKSLDLPKMTALLQKVQIFFPILGCL